MKEKSQMRASRIAITFDVDMTNYLEAGHAVIDEMAEVFPLIQKVLSKYPEILTTWFIRIDSHTEEIFGSPLFVFEKHADKVDWLRAKGHEVGWHFHSYRKSKEDWEQNRNEDEVVKELEGFAEMALEHGVKTLRMGWGYHTNKTLKKAAEMGIKIDSSAIPRPIYPWENGLRDWSTTGQQPYFPSAKDIRVSSEDSLSILEVPMSTVPLAAKTDTMEGVRRLINTSYRSDRFEECLESYEQHTIVANAHPYEMLPGYHHPLLAFDLAEFEKNLIGLTNRGMKFLTVSDVAEPYL